MIELTFRTPDGPMVVQIETPVATPETPTKPWTTVVRFNGRPSKMYGEDPLDSLDTAVRFAQMYLHDREGLDPAVSPPVPYQTTPPEPPDSPEPPDPEPDPTDPNAP